MPDGDYGLPPEFWAKVDQNGPDGCWLWTGRLNEGYGRMAWGYAHRVMYLAAHGEIREGFQIDHLCRVRNCVNPDHMEVVTPRENILRGVSPVAVNARKTHCPEGHPLSGWNLYERGGGRKCRRCMLRRQREYRQRKAAA